LKIFLDTSAFVKLYVREAKTDEVFELLQHGEAEFDLDIYKIIKKHFKTIASHQIIKLPLKMQEDQGC